MGRPMIMRPLAQRLKTAGRKGILRSNSPENPFWIPEENPILRVWDMTLEEYCGTVQRAAGLDLKAECGEALCAAWPELNQGDWNICYAVNSPQLNTALAALNQKWHAPAREE